jgi:hypothetical protein
VKYHLDRDVGDRPKPFPHLSLLKDSENLLLTLMAQMPPKAIDECLGHRPPTLGIVLSELGESALKELQKIQDDLGVPQAKLVDREALGTGSSSFRAARLLVKNLTLACEKHATFRRESNVRLAHR